MTLSLIQSSYAVVGGDRVWTFSLVGGESVFSVRNQYHRPTVTGATKIWGKTDGQTAIVKAMGSPRATWTISSGYHMVTPASFSGGAPTAGTSERAFIVVPWIERIETSSFPKGDDINAPIAMELSFDPPLPAWAWGQTPTHVIYHCISGTAAMIPPTLYSADTDTGLRDASIAWPYYRNAAFGQQTDSVMDRAWARDLKANGRVLIRNSDNGIYAGVGAEHEIPFTGISYRHWPLPSYTAAGIRAVFAGSPAPTTTDITVRYHPYYAVPDFWGTIPTNTITITTGDVAHSFAGTYDGFDFYTASGTVDIEASMPDDCAFIFYIAVEAYTGYDEIAITAPCNCGFPAGACRDALTGVWLPGRILKVGQVT